MNKILILIFLLTNFSLFFSQRIGVIQNFNPNIKHVHLKGGWNYKTSNIEDLKYNILQDIDSIYIENKIEPQKLNDFDFSMLNYYDPLHPNQNKKIEENLKNYCLEKNIEALIIFMSNNFYHSLNPIKTLNSDGYDIAIMTKDESQNKLLYYNNIRWLYYKVKTNKIEYPFVKIERPNYFGGIPVKTQVSALNKETKLLNNSDIHLKNFLNLYKRILNSNINEIITKIKE